MHAPSLRCDKGFGYQEMKTIWLQSNVLGNLVKNNYVGLICIPLQWGINFIYKSRKEVSLSQSRGNHDTAYLGRAVCCRVPLPCAAPGRCPLHKLGQDSCMSGSSCSAHHHMWLSILTRMTSKTTCHPLGRDTKSHTLESKPDRSNEVTECFTEHFGAHGNKGTDDSWQ
jgi:hypothetical protein